MNRRLRSTVRYPQQYIFVLLLSWNLMPGQQTISTKENLPDIAPPKRGRRASIHVPSTPTFQVPEPVAPFTQVPPANDTSSQEVGQTQVKYGPPKKKTAIRASSTASFQVAEPVAPFTQAPANDTGIQEVGQTQIKYGPPKKKTVAAAVEEQQRPSSAKLFNGVHIQARVQSSR